MRVQVPDRRVQVDRLDRVPGEEVDDVEHLRQPDQVLVVRAIADPSAAVRVDHVRGAGDRPEGRPVAADLEVVGRVGRVQRERRRRRPDPLGRPSPGRTGRAPNPGRTSAPAAAQELARLGVEEVHPDLLEHAERGLVDRLELVLGDDRRRRVADAAAGPTAVAAAAGCVRGPRDRPMRRRRAAAARPLAARGRSSSIQSPTGRTRSS